MRRNLLQLWHLHGCSWIVKTPIPHAGKHFLTWFTLISEMTKFWLELAKISQLAAQSHPCIVQGQNYTQEIISRWCTYRCVHGDRSKMAGGKMQWTVPCSISPRKGSHQFWMSPLIKIRIENRVWYRDLKPCPPLKTSYFTNGQTFIAPCLKISMSMTWFKMKLSSGSWQYLPARSPISSRGSHLVRWVFQ